LGFCAINIKDPGLRRAGLVLLLCLTLSGCSSPEQQKQQRLSTLNTFTKAAVTDLLDRNPSTMSDSMNRVFTYEFSEEARQKLMRRNLLPETGLSVVKIIQDQQSSKTSNSVSVSKIKPLGAITRPVIPVQVISTQTAIRAGKELSKRRLDLNLKIMLPSDPDSNPQVVDVDT
jgi:hypothetical protein